LAVVAGMKKTNDHAEPTKVERQKDSLAMLSSRTLLCIVFIQSV